MVLARKSGVLLAYAAIWRFDPPTLTRLYKIVKIHCKRVRARHSDVFLRHRVRTLGIVLAPPKRGPPLPGKWQLNKTETCQAESMEYQTGRIASPISGKLVMDGGSQADPQTVTYLRSLPTKLGRERL